MSEFVDHVVDFVTRNFETLQKEDNVFLQTLNVRMLYFSVRGYLPSSPQASNNLMGVDVVQETLRDLNQKRQNLLLELKNYEENLKVACQAFGYAETRETRVKLEFCIFNPLWY